MCIYFSICGGKLYRLIWGRVITPSPFGKVTLIFRHFGKAFYDHPLRNQQVNIKGLNNDNEVGRKTTEFSAALHKLITDCYEYTKRNLIIVFFQFQLKLSLSKKTICLKFSNIFVCVSYKTLFLKQ